MFNGLVTVTTEITAQGDIVTCDLSHFQIEESCSSTELMLWEERLKSLKHMVEELVTSRVDIAILERVIESSIKDFANRYSNVEPIGFLAFELASQCGEFYFGSNRHGCVDLETNEVEFNSHGLEILIFKSLRDFYNCYILEIPTPYQYACLLANWDEDGELENYDQEHEEILKRLLPEQPGEESDVWSDFVEVSAPGAAYSSRITPIQLKGEFLQKA